jgi:hypothetical protein
VHVSKSFIFIRACLLFNRKSLSSHLLHDANTKVKPSAPAVFWIFVRLIFSMAVSKYPVSFYSFSILDRLNLDQLGPASNNYEPLFAQAGQFLIKLN